MTTLPPFSPSASLVVVPGEAQATNVALPGEPAVQAGRGFTRVITVVEDEAWAAYQRAATGGRGSVAGPVPEDTRTAGGTAEAAALLTVTRAAIAARRPDDRWEAPVAHRLRPGPGRWQADPAAPTSTPAAAPAR
ncbi:hypothetical protein [Streptomyces klenkii]|uniref:hypothetical protein n=1 Tax=Streptomyces klenkii TaxID=1420899 RepID=UPI0034352BB4